MGRLDGKRALVSGTGGGIGRATGLLLAREEAHVVGGDPIDQLSYADWSFTMRNARRRRPAASIAARVPLGRWGQPQDVANAIFFLCSDEAAHVSGANIPVDGGAAAVG